MDTRIGRTRKVRWDRQVAYHANIIGKTWQGLIGSYSYTFYGTEPTISQVTSKAGDFARVIDYQVVKVETQNRTMPRGWQEIRTLMVTQDWARSDSEQAFRASQAG